jgi:hypothetical protein
MGCGRRRPQSLPRPSRAQAQNEDLHKKPLEITERQVNLIFHHNPVSHRKVDLDLIGRQLHGAVGGGESGPHPVPLDHCAGPEKQSQHFWCEHSFLFESGPTGEPSLSPRRRQSCGPAVPQAGHWP